MHFSIHKTFSRLRSDTSSSADYAGVLPTWRRFSMSEIEEICNNACTSWENLSSHGRSLSDSEVLLPKATTVGVTTKLFSAPSLSPAPPNELLQPKTDQLLQDLVRENKILRNENIYLKFEAQVREEELAKYRSKYCAEKFNATIRKHILGFTFGRGETPAKPVPLKSFRPPPKIHRPKYRVGETGSKNVATTGVIQQDAVLSPSNTITVCAAKTNGCLDVMTSIKGNNDAPRAQRVATTRKLTKRVNLFSAGSDRPGASILGYREHKMDDLLKRLRTGSVTLAPTTASRCPNTPEGSSSISHTPIHVSASHNRGRNLAPLASEIFKSGIKDSLSHVKRSSTKKNQPVFNDVDINRTSSRIGSCGAKKSIEYSGASAKALRKRKAILLEHPPLDSVIDVCGKSISNESHFRANNGTIESHLPPLGPETSTTHSSEDLGALSAEKALLSLERLCAGFSSGSLGSLESTSDPSSVNDPLVDVPSLFVMDTTVAANQLLSVRSRDSPGLESPSFSRLFIKTSTPSVPRNRSSILSSPFRPAATSSPKTLPNSTVGTPQKCISPMHYTNVTDSVSSQSPPTKKFVRKPISPLRIAKKGKSNVYVKPTPSRV